MPALLHMLMKKNEINLCVLRQLKNAHSLIILIHLPKVTFYNKSHSSKVLLSILLKEYVVTISFMNLL